MIRQRTFPKILQSVRQEIEKDGRFKVVLVEPEYEINLGFVARAMANFGFSELALVNPKCDPKGENASMYSKHAKPILENVQIYPSLSSATSDCRLLVGTTGVLVRHRHITIRDPISLIDFKKMLKGKEENKVALIFGNEGTGLSEKDVSSCDFLITIPTNPVYPVLNLSHAVAIVLYELSEFNIPVVFAQKKEKEALIKTLWLYVEKYKKSLRNPRKLKIAIRRLVGKSMLSEQECKAVLGILRKAYKDIKIS
jgi:tRNA/rRNA methyltransferase